MGRKGSGLEIRGASIRVKFTLDGKTFRERVTLNGKSLQPTPANIKFAFRLSAEVRRRIAIGNFNFSEFFPDSPHARALEEEVTTFGGLANLWLEAQGRLTPATQDQYKTAVRFWKRLLGHDTRIKDLNHKILASRIGGYPWPSAKTHNNYLIALRGIFRLEYRGAASLNNPLIGIENMPLVRKLPDPLTINERDSILTDMQERYDVRVVAYFQWMFYSGTRPEEAIALRWSDVDWSRQVVRVRRVRTFRGTERDGSKTHGERDVDLVPQALHAIMLMKPYTFTLEIKRENDPDTTSDIFQNPVTENAWHDERSQRENYWKPCLKRLGIRWRKQYNTRHTYATVALMAGVPPAYIASQLGHSIKMLLDKYALWLPLNDSGTSRALLIAAMELVPNKSQSKNGTS